LRTGTDKGRYLNVASRFDENHHSGNPVFGQKFVGVQRIWATIAAAGTTVPYGGNVSPVTGIFTNV
jgi:hypothetical protein